MKKVFGTGLLFHGEEGAKPIVGNQESTELVMGLPNQGTKTGVQRFLNKEVLVISCKEPYS